MFLEAPVYLSVNKGYSSLLSLVLFFLGGGGYFGQWSFPRGGGGRGTPVCGPKSFRGGTPGQHLEGTPGQDRGTLPSIHRTRTLVCSH